MKKFNVVILLFLQSKQICNFNRLYVPSAKSLILLQKIFSLKRKRRLQFHRTRSGLYDILSTECGNTNLKEMFVLIYTCVHKCLFR